MTNLLPGLPMVAPGMMSVCRSPLPSTKVSRQPTTVDVMYRVYRLFALARWTSSLSDRGIILLGGMALPVRGGSS